MVVRPQGGRAAAAGECFDPASWCYWRREAAFYGSGLATALPAGLRAPRPYGVTEHDAEARIWMEHVPAPEHRWSLDDFQHAGRAAGRSAGAFLSGRPVPADPWLARGFLRSILAGGGFWATTMDPATGDTWRSPLAEPFGARTRERVLRLWAGRDRLLAAAEALPPVLGHGDLHPRNIMLPAGADDIFAVDWGFCGPAPLGADLGDLVYGPVWFCDVEIADLPAVEDAAFAGYHAGLGEAGWRGDPRLVRLGFAAQVAVRMAACMPGWAALMLGPERAASSKVLYRRPVAAVLEAWTALAELTLDLADEAFALAGELESAA